MEKTEKRKVTITQVAKLAGVSVGTVSNFLNATVPVSRDRADRIQAAIDTLEYTPDMTARSLRSKSSSTVYILTPNLSNDFYTEIISSFMKYAYKDGYTVRISGYEYSMEMERRQLRVLESNKPGTVIIIFNGHSDEAEIQRLTDKGMHVILADRETTMERTSSVTFDNQQIMFDIVGMLKEKGYQSIGFFTEPLVLVNLQERYNSFLAAMQYYGYQNAEKWFYTRKSLVLDKLKNSYLYMKEILETYSREELPDAWVVTSDYLAIGVMRAMNEKGYHIPGDFGIVGYDNLNISGYVNPRLTTAEQDQALMGKSLWKVVKKISGTNQYEHMVLPQKIIIRESC